MIPGPRTAPSVSNLWHHKGPIQVSCLLGHLSARTELPHKSATDQSYHRARRPNATFSGRRPNPVLDWPPIRWIAEKKNGVIQRYARPAFDNLDSWSIQSSRWLSQDLALHPRAGRCFFLFSRCLVMTSPMNEIKRAYVMSPYGLWATKHPPAVYPESNWPWSNAGQMLIWSCTPLSQLHQEPPC